MATTYTTNYNLGKQENHADKFDMDVITDNADKIDAALTGLQSSIDGKQATLTTAQLAAVNSGIDSADVDQITMNKNNISLKANTSDVNTATANLQSQIDDISEKVYSNVPTVFSSASGFYGKDGSYAEFSDIYACELSVTTGEQYLLSSKSFYDMARAVFFDASDNFVGSVWTSNDDAENVNTRVTVPAHAVKMLLQRFSTNSVKLDKYTHSTTTAQKTIYANETVKSNLDYLNEGFSSAIRNVYSDVPLTFTSVTGYYNRFGGYSVYANMSACDIVVTVGERYSLTSKSFYDAVRVAFFDTNDNLISFVWSSGDNNNNVNTEIIVPNGAVKMRLQRHGSDAVILGEYASSRTGNSLVSKKITVIGDSITEYNYRAKINWALYMAEWTGAEFQNLGVSGTGFATSNQPYINRISSIQESPDLIGVALSWNDLAAGLPVGETTDTGTSSLCGYANDFFTALITAFPTTPIICYCQGPWGSARPSIASSDNWYAALETICKNKGVPFYGHLYIGGVLKPWVAANQAEYYVSDNDSIGNVGSTDQVHPNSKGHKYIATYFMQKFAQNVTW